MSTSNMLHLRVIYSYDMQQVALGSGTFLLLKTHMTHLLYV